MDYSCFNYELKGHVAHVILSRGKELNTMTKAFWSELPHLIDNIANNGDARVILLSAKGKHFCAGMDLSVFTGGGGSNGAQSEGEAGRQRANLRRHILELQETFTAFEKARMPVLAAMQGGVIGGAVDMITACDMRYMSEEAFVCIQETNIGMTADVGTLQRLPKIIPEGIARELAYTGRRMPATEAKACGLVNEIFPDAEALRESVLGIAKQIAAKSPLAIWGTKEMINYSRDHSVEDSLNYIATWQTGMFQPTDMAEAFTAKSENRDPEFHNLMPTSKPI